MEMDNQQMQLTVLPDFDALIFDADGTLVDTESTTIEVLYELANPHGFCMSIDEVFRVFRGRRMALCIEQIQSTLAQPLPSSFIDDVRQETAKRFERGVSTMPGAQSLVHFLHTQQLLPYCVATNGPRMKVSQTLEMSGLIRYFEDRIYCAYEVGSFKPEPGLFLHAAQALGVSPARCAVVEDSMPGVHAALLAGMHVFYVGPQDLLDLNCREQVYSIDHLDLLHQHLQKRLQKC
jgi:HAD superfamily hydrolase (TIGR01509 family)